MNEIKMIPTVALRGLTILPGMVIHFDLSRQISIKAVENAMLGDQKILAVTQHEIEVEHPTREDLYNFGTICIIKQIVRLPKGFMRVLVEGIERAELVELYENGEYLRADAFTFDIEEESIMTPEAREAAMRYLKDTLMNYSVSGVNISKDSLMHILDVNDLENLIDEIGNNLPLGYREQQQLLEAISLQERLDALSLILTREAEVQKYKAELQKKVHERIDKNQKEYFMREQLKIIREELGDDTTLTDADNWEETVNKLKAPKEVKEKLLKEIRRFRSSMNNTAEMGVIRTYIETMLEMPWDKLSKDSKDLKKAAQVLDEDHYGLTEVKERVIEFLAVRLLTKKGESPILCLVGPPGTGKTSIAKSIARALGRKYVRISLGGIRDEAEIRGHRKTYVGAMPGRIANALRMAGTKNPLILLDEVDKISTDHNRGDTFSALLEVLDSDQNKTFRDHYLEVPLDLSEVMFITTANTTETIPRPLLDRMELIEISSYTENEKEHIAKEHLIPKQIKAHGIGENNLRISDRALFDMIHNYTREAGVRQLERKIGEICRKSARKILEDKDKTVNITERNLEKYLGKKKFTFESANEQDEIGIVTGLAWTSVGGDTLKIEVNSMKGKGEILLTGKLGDVMKESAQAGISYIRSIGSRYDIDENYFAEHDIHVHIPEGAVPKDGPSAGITMATAILSAASKRPVRADLAMTGEITLRGRVLPIGGLKEKLLAAKNAGIKTVLVPEKNERDVEDISTEITKGLEIVFVSSMDQVLKQAFR